MGKLIDGDDGLPAESVGRWAKEKHDLLCRYVDICRSARKRYLPPQIGGATYIDLFCGTGRAKIRETGEWIDGGALAAWKSSVEGGAPFTKIIIADADGARLEAARVRLERAGAPVTTILGPAKETAFKARQKSATYGLNFAFLDPYNLETMDFEAFRHLSKITRIDILIHVSTMDLQRNTARYTSEDATAFDAFAPGWREVVDVNQSLQSVREGVVSHWRELAQATGVWLSDDVRLVTGSRQQRLYWLMLAARHPLAHKFWTEVVRDRQGQLDL